MGFWDYKAILYRSVLKWGMKSLVGVPRAGLVVVMGLWSLEAHTLHPWGSCRSWWLWTCSSRDCYWRRMPDMLVVRRWLATMKLAAWFCSASCFSSGWHVHWIPKCRSTFHGGRTEVLLLISFNSLLDPRIFLCGSCLAIVWWRIYVSIVFDELMIATK